MSSSLVRATLRALLVPRRLLPILLVCIPLVLAQGSLSADRRAAPIAVALCLAFVVFAPLSWRVLFPEGLDLGHGAIRLVLYAAIGAGFVLTIGFVVPKLLGMEETFLTSRPTLLASGALFLVGGWGLARDIGMEESLARARADVERAELLALRSHLDPHFLFNTLNAIAEWCREDGVTAERAVLQLSAMLRTVLEGVKAPRWPMEKELELVRTFFDLHLLRDPARFRVRIDAPETDGLTVPPMLLLPLAENAVKHGPAAGHQGVVTLEVRRNGKGVVVRIANPGPYLGPRPGSDGLPMVRKRLAQAYGEGATLDLRSEDGGTTAEMVLPL